MILGSFIVASQLSSILITFALNSSYWYFVCVDTGHRTVAQSTFRSLWLQLLPHIVFSRPMTDLCWTCQRNYRIISSSSNLPEVVKSAKLRKQQEHLAIVQEERSVYQVQEERSVYQSMVQNCRKSCTAVSSLQTSAPCSSSVSSHYSFDFAQQVHLPYHPLQPEPVYFLCPRKVGIFGICCEGLPQQVNFLNDEAHLVSKGSSAIISYLHYFFEHYGLGECEVDLHCDNCSGQNKNNFVLAYLMWRTLRGLHHRVSLHFLIAGHTKFAPDWCFGLLKKAFRRTRVSNLQELSSCIQSSTNKSVSIAQLVGSDNGPAEAPVYDWQSFLGPLFKAVLHIKDQHHFAFLSSKPGIVMYRQLYKSEEQSFCMLKIPISQVTHQGFL